MLNSRFFRSIFRPWAWLSMVVMEITNRISYVCVAIVYASNYNHMSIVILHIHVFKHMIDRHSHIHLPILYLLSHNFNTHAVCYDFYPITLVCSLNNICIHMQVNKETHA